MDLIYIREFFNVKSYLTEIASEDPDTFENKMDKLPDAMLHEAVVNFELMKSRW
jgi:hypothetical protein